MISNAEPLYMGNTMTDRAQFHGHVRPRADGYKARCGGPALCETCQAEQELRGLAAEYVDELLPPDAMERIFGGPRNER